MTAQRTSFLCLLTLAAACGGAETSSPSTATSSPLEAYLAADQQVAAAVTTYQGATQAPSATSRCQADQASYDAAANSALAGLNAAAAQLDRATARNGRGAAGQDGELACRIRAMTAEMARHRAQACTSQDAAANLAEAQQHLALMTQWMEQARTRARAQDGLGGCQENADGSFNVDDQVWNPGRGDGTCDCEPVCQQKCVATCVEDGTQTCAEVCASRCKAACVDAAQ